MSILNRIKINIKETETETEYDKTYQYFDTWCKLHDIKNELNLMPNVTQFSFLPSKKFYGLKFKEINKNNPLVFEFECDKWEDIEL